MQGIQNTDSNLSQFTMVMARDPEKLIKLCTMLLYSVIMTVSLYFAIGIENDPCGFWQFLICKSSEDSVNEFAEGVSLVIPN